MYVGAQSKTIQNPESIEAMTPEDDKMVTGVFKNRENPGQPAYIGCRLYKGQPIYQRTFWDGEEAEIPYSVARFINEYTQYPRHNYLLDEKGNYIKGTGDMVKRYEFVPTKFS